MSEPMTPRDGGCRCGRVRFTVTAPPLATMVCHCRGCQRLTASAFSLSVAVPSSAFTVTKGEPVPGGLQEGALKHSYCPHCKSWMFTRFEGMEHFVNLRSTLLDEPGDWTTPFVETFASEKLPWVTTPAVHRFPAFPPMEAWEGFMQDYAAQQQRAATPPPRAG